MSAGSLGTKFGSVCRVGGYGSALYGGSERMFGGTSPPPTGSHIWMLQKSLSHFVHRVNFCAPEE